MTAWPALDELKQLLDITDDRWDGEDEYGETTRLSRLLEAAIAQVKADVGHWDELVDEPDAPLAQAALRLAELMGVRPTSEITVLRNDPTYRSLVRGHRRVFGIA